MLEHLSLENYREAWSEALDRAYNSLPKVSEPKLTEGYNNFNVGKGYSAYVAIQNGVLHHIAVSEDGVLGNTLYVSGLNEEDIDFYRKMEYLGDVDDVDENGERTVYVHSEEGEHVGIEYDTLLSKALDVLDQCKTEGFTFA